MSGSIWVIVEHRDGEVRKVSLESIGLARHLASQKGWEVVALVLGHGQEACAKKIAEYPADRVCYFDHADLKDMNAEGYATAVAGKVAGGAPVAILMGATSAGRDLAGKLAARLKVGLLADIIAVELEGDDTLVARRPQNAGKVVATVSTGPERPQIVSVRAKAFPLPAPKGTMSPVEAGAYTPPPGGLKVSLVEVLRAASARAELTEADIVVSGGRGMKGPENFHLIEGLAEALGAAVGASRAVVDAGWRDHSEQVGQTGKTVAPNVYIACGISGAIQHLVGMTNSKVVFAINKDAEAPIFKRANYGIVGDALEVLPKLTEEIKKAKSA